MPKLKSHSGTKKRVKKTATGKLIRERAFAVHNLSKQSASRKRNNSKSNSLSGGNSSNVKRALA